MKKYIKNTIKSIDIVNRLNEMEYFRLKVTSKPNSPSLQEIEKQPFYITIGFLNGQFETVLDDDSVIYFATQNEAEKYIKSIII